MTENTNVYRPPRIQIGLLKNSYETLRMEDSDMLRDLYVEKQKEIGEDAHNLVMRAINLTRALTAAEMFRESEETRKIAMFWLEHSRVYITKKNLLQKQERILKARKELE